MPAGQVTLNIPGVTHPTSAVASTSTIPAGIS